MSRQFGDWRKHRANGPLSTRAGASRPTVFTVSGFRRVALVIHSIAFLAIEPGRSDALKLAAD